MALSRDQILQWITEHPNYTGADFHKTTPFKRISDRAMHYRRIRDLEALGCITRTLDGPSGFRLRATGKPYPGRLQTSTTLLREENQYMIQIMQEQDDRIAALETAVFRLTSKLDPKP